MSRRTPLKKIREILRIKHSNPDFSNRQIARAINVSHPVVNQSLIDFKKTGLSYEDIKELNDESLIEIIQGKRGKKNNRYSQLSTKFEYFAKELTRRGVTLKLLWEEYIQSNPDGYSLSQFMYHYQMWRATSDITMHMEYKAGEKMFVDFAGQKMHYFDKKTGEKIYPETFVAVLGCSQYTYVEAVHSQQKQDFIGATENAFLYFDGVTTAVVPDNLKSAVTKSCRYEPTLNPEYSLFSKHYETVILPARPGKPKDKALVENAVKIVYAWIYAALRDRVFYSLAELNAAILEQLDKYNSKPLQKLKISRKQLFEETEKEFLKPLPANLYEYRAHLKATVQISYHVYMKEDKNYYSVPYQYRGRKVDLFYTKNMVEIFCDHERVALHMRARIPGKYITKKVHMPSHHQFVADWNPKRFLRWAQEIGKETYELVDAIFNRKQHPEQAFKICQGILQGLEKKYGPERLNNACKKALELDHYSYRGVRNILENNMDKRTEDDLFSGILPDHANLRGSKYYN